jgi:hypothetical protein
MIHGGALEPKNSSTFMLDVVEQSHGDFASLVLRIENRFEKIQEIDRQNVLSILAEA